MSLEVKIQELTETVNRLIDALHNQKSFAPVVPVPQAAPITSLPVAPIVQAVPVAPAAPIIQPTAVMPPLPTFAVPVAPPPATVAPFADSKGLIEYVMGAYKEMGAAKGAGIQGVLTSLGYQNINDVSPDHYFDLYVGVEKLKGGAV